VLFAVKNVGLELPTRKRGPGIKSGLQLCYFWEKKEAIYRLTLEITTGCTLTYFTAVCTLVASLLNWGDVFVRTHVTEKVGVLCDTNRDRHRQ
jgi:hypothetical protein